MHKVNEADFINVVVFRKQAKNVNDYLSKGSLAGVDGRVQSRNYENNEGRRVFVTEVVADSVQFLDTKGNNQQNNQPQKQQEQTTTKIILLLTAQTWIVQNYRSDWND